MRKLKQILLLSFILLLIGCSNQQARHYEKNSPKLDMHSFFSGEILGWGMFQNRNNQVKKRFKVTINAFKKNQKIILDEQFSWDDGSKTQRIWTLTEQKNSEWIGTASDVIGKAKGKVVGNALHWKYRLKLPVDDTIYEINFDDWMYLIDKKVMLNRSIMSKWGINLGSITLTLIKE